MNDLTRTELLQNSEDSGTNDSANLTFESVLQTRLFRRSILKGTFGAAATCFFGLGSAAAIARRQRGLTLNFNHVAKSLDDVVSVPAGYAVTVLYCLGDPINSATAEFCNDGTGSAESFAFRAGDHHDGMHYFSLHENVKSHESISNSGLLKKPQIN